jgi:hypothetical protein
VRHKDNGDRLRKEFGKPEMAKADHHLFGLVGLKEKIRSSGAFDPGCSWTRNGIHSFLKP